MYGERVINENEYYLLTEDDKNKIIEIDFEDNHEKIYFPSWIKKLMIKKYNHKLDNLPENLEKLDIMFCGNKCEIDLYDLPESLEHLQMYNYKETINYLPKNIKILSLSGEYSNNFSNIPNNLKNLWLLNTNHIAVNLDSLPSNIENLYLKNYDIPLYNLPNNLKRLSIECHYNHNLDNLPINLEYLYIEHYDIPLNFLPENLKELCVLYSENKQIFNNLPLELEVLTIPCIYESITNLPKKLKKIIICERGEKEKTEIMKEEIINILGDIIIEIK